VAPKGGQIQGMNHDEKGDKVEVDVQLREADPAKFDAVVLPGGVANSDKLRVEDNAKRFVQAMDRAGKPIAVICHGPWLLVSAGLTKGRHLTSYHTLADDIRNSGAKWTDEEVVLDKNWVSSRQPDDIPAFNKAMLALFAEGGAASKAKGAGHR
jgi:protease I